MIWHIFRKDACLLWPLVVVVGAIHLITALLLIAIGKFGEPPNLQSLWGMLSVLALLAMAFLIVITLHQDAIPGVRQDWLIRPVRRTDLLFAKLLFVLLLVIAPMFVVDIATGLAEGLTVSPSVKGALLRSAAVLALVGSLGLIVGAMTRNLIQAMVVVAAGVVSASAIMISISELTDIGSGLVLTNLAWMRMTAWTALASIVALVVLPLQYFRRYTAVACSIASAGLLGAALMPWVPWHTAFFLQQSMRDSTAANGIELAYSPMAGRAKADAGLTLPESYLNRVPERVFLPLEVTGLAANSRLMFDGVDVRVLNADNKVIYQDHHNLSVFGGGGPLLRKRLEVEPPLPGDQGSTVHHALWIPQSVYAELKDQTVQLELEYAITLFQSGATHTIAALDSNQTIKGLGVCDARVGGDGDEIQAVCASTQLPPSCFSVFLRQPIGNQRNPESHVCLPEYGITLDLAMPFKLWGGELSFRDLAGQTSYAVDGTELEGAEIVISAYEPTAHFTRKIVIPTIRLSDWLPQ